MCVREREGKRGGGGEGERDLHGKLGEVVDGHNGACHCGVHLQEGNTTQGLEEFHLKRAEAKARIWP